MPMTLMKLPAFQALMYICLSGQSLMTPIITKLVKTKKKGKSAALLQGPEASERPADLLLH